MTDKTDTFNSALLTSDRYAANGKNNGDAAQPSDPMSYILYAYDLESRGDVSEARKCKTSDR